MNAFVVSLCAVVVVIQAATIPEAGVKTEAEPLKPAEQEDQASDPIPAAQTVPFGADRNLRQIYPAGYPNGQLQKAVYSPYPLSAAAPAYPYPAYYPAYPGYPGYPAQYVPLRDGEAAGAEESSWSSYLPSYSSFANYFSGPGSYFSNYPSYYPSQWFGTSEAETSGATTSEAESNTAAQVRSGLPKNNNKVQTINSVNSIRPFAPAPAFAPAPVEYRYQPAPVARPQFVVAGTPQLQGAYSPFHAQHDPSKLTAANNGAISSYLFLRNQPQLPVFQQNQQKFAAPAGFQTGHVNPSPQSFMPELQGEQSKQVEKESTSSENNQIVADAAPSAESSPTVSGQAEDSKKSDESSGSASGQ